MWTLFVDVYMSMYSVFFVLSGPDMWWTEPWEAQRQEKLVEQRYTCQRPEDGEASLRRDASLSLSLSLSRLSLCLSPCVVCDVSVVLSVVVVVVVEEGEERRGETNRTIM